jgi:hypothetical protein
MLAGCPGSTSVLSGLPSPGEDVHLMFLNEALTFGHQGEELVLVLSNRGCPAKLDHLTQSVAPERWTKSLVHELDEFLPGWSAPITFDHREPLGSIAGHVEGGQEDLVGGLGFLDVEELIAPIQPR